MVLSSVPREDQLYCRNLHKTTYITLFQNAFPVVHADCVTSVNLEIYKPISEHGVVVILDFCICGIHCLNFQRVDESIQGITLKNKNIMASYMHHCTFLKQKMGFQTSE